jgi:hypothetical protein
MALKKSELYGSRAMKLAGDSHSPAHFKDDATAEELFR